MSILYPLMALGVFAVGVPIWLHLRRRDESNLVEFSTLRFLDDQPIARARPLWPQNWPLLLLRILALLLLIAAFAWPYVEGEEAIIVKESRVYILDNTLSHQVDDGFATARESIASDLAANDRTTQIGVVELATTASTVVRFGDDKLTAAASIREMQPSAERGGYGDAFRSAAEMLNSSLGAKRRIVLLSDSQANQWALRESSPPFLDSEIDVELSAATETPPNNLSLSVPRARRVARDGEPWIEAAVALGIQGTHENAAVVFRDGGREVYRQPIDFDAERDPSLASGVVFAQWQVDSDQWVIGEAMIESDGDALAGDDRVVFSLPPLRVGRVELMTDSLFLRRALDPDVMFGRWQVQVSDSTPAADRDGEAAPDVLCVDSRKLVSNDVRTAIRDDLSRGRGVLMMVNDSTPLIAGFLRELGIEFNENQTVAAAPATFRYLFAEHPIFAPFRTSEMGNLAEIEFSDYRRLKVRDATPLAFSAAGDPLALEAMVGPGRMLVLAFAFERDDTNWPIHPTFIPFVDKVLGYLRGQTMTLEDYEPGESVAWELPPGAATDQILVAALDPTTGGSPTTGRGVADDRDSLRVEVQGRSADFQLPSQPGHYAVRYNETDSMVAVFDVNPSPLESDLQYAPEPDAIETWRREPEEAAEEQDDSADPMALTQWEALQQPYWWYLILAAGTVFLAESLYGAMSSRAR